MTDVKKVAAVERRRKANIADCRKRRKEKLDLIKEAQSTAETIEELEEELQEARTRISEINRTLHQREIQLEIA